MSIVYAQIAKTHEMQMDLIKDGEMPLALSNAEDYEEMLIDCEDLQRGLARELAKGMACEAEAYAETYKLCTGYIEDKDRYWDIKVYNILGELIINLCVPADANNWQLGHRSMALALQSIMQDGRKVLWC